MGKGDDPNQSLNRSIDSASAAQFQEMVSDFNRAVHEKRGFTRAHLRREDKVQVDFPTLESSGEGDRVIGNVTDLSYSGLFFVPVVDGDIKLFKLLSYHQMRLLLEGEVHHMIVVIANMRAGGAGVQFNDAVLLTKKALAKFLYAKMGKKIVQELNRLERARKQIKQARPARRRR